MPSNLTLNTDARKGGARRSGDRTSRWALELQQRRGYYRTLVAIANKNARIAWALLAKEEALRQN